MKKLLSFMMAVLMVVSLAACSKPAEDKKKEEPKSTTESKKDEVKPAEEKKDEVKPAEVKPAEVKKMTLTVWGPQEDQAPRDGFPKGILAHFCEKFNEEHPEWDIEFKYGVAGEDVAKDEVTKDLEKAADVFMYANDQLPFLVESGAIAKLGGKNLDKVKEMNSESMINSVSYKGSVYGVPFAYNGWFMYYDKSKFTEEEVKDLDVMLAKDLGEGVTNVMFPLSNSWFMPAFFYGVGGTMFGADGTDGSKGCDFNDEKGLAVANYLVELMAMKPKFDNKGNEEAGKEIAAFEKGKLGAYFSGSWDRENIEKALGQNFGCAQLPSFTAGNFKGTMKSFAGSKAIGVNPTSKNMAAAVSLAVYLGSQEAQKVRYEARKVVPLDSTGLNDEMLTAITNTVNNTSVAQPLVSEMSNWWVPAETFGKSVVSGETTKDNVKEKLDNFVNNVNKGSGL